MIPTNYSSPHRRGSFWKTAFLTTVLALCNTFLIGQTNCTADAGSLNGEICIQNQEFTLRGTLRGDTTVPTGYQVLYVLTRGDDLIIAEVSEEASFTVDSLEGVYTIHTLVYDTATLDLDSIVLGTTTAGQIFSRLIAGGGTICAALDTAGVKFRFGNCDDTDACEAETGRLTAVAGACLDDSTATLTATIADSAEVPDGYTLLYVLTSTDSLVIEAVNTQPTFTVDTTGTYRIHVLVYDSTTLDLDSLVTFGETTGGAVNALLIQGGGDICAALDVTGALFNIEACDDNVDTCDIDLGRLTAGNNPCLEDSTVTLTATVQDSAEIPDGYALLYVLTSGDSLLIEQVAATPSFVVDTTGEYRIHILVYDSTTLDLDSVVLGTTSALAVNELLVQGGGEICAALDTEGILFDIAACSDNQDTCIVNAGRLAAVNDDVCLDEDEDEVTIAVSIRVAPTVPDSFARLFVLTSGDSLIIQQVSTTPSFDIDSVGEYRIHLLVYDSTTLDLDSIVLGSTSALAVNRLLIQGGGTICAALDTVGVLFDIEECDDNPQDTCNVDLGRLAVVSDSCVTEGIRLTARVQSAPIVPQGFVVTYVLASGDSAVILQRSNTPTFVVDSAGTYSIHTLIYDPTTFDTTDIVFGTTERNDLFTQFIQGGGDLCGAIDVNGVVFTVEECCEADAGALTFAGGTTCLSDSTLTLRATVAQEATVPDGFDVIYVLTSGDDLVIEQVSDSASFVIDTTGRFTIHTLVYDSTTLNLDSIVIGETTGADVNALLIQGGGDICGALDVEGLVFNIDTCSTNTDTCTVTSGSLRIVGEDFCIDSTGTATLRAAIQTVPNIPPGYQITYLLSSGDSLVAEQRSDTATFTVDTVGRYRIHIIVFDSTAIDLDSVITFGETRGIDVDSLFGDSICGAINLNGVVFDVTQCDTVPPGQDSCRADVGRLSAVSTSCLNDSTATISAEVLEAATVPTGYATLYVLTRGDSLIITAVDNEPTFTVSDTGRYTIHTLVYDSTTLDLNIVAFDSTQATVINNLLIQGGGEICGALDVTGVVFNVIDCGNDSICVADPGRLLILGDEDDFCIDSTGTDSIALRVSVQTAPIVPAGFARLFVLTSGDSLTIEAVSTTPTFDVDSVGDYRIHILVYDTATVDLDSLVTFGETTAADINALLIQGGGDICSALDTIGVLFSVDTCTTTPVDTTCAARTGTLTATNTPCIEDSTATLTATVVQAPTVPAGYQVIYVLTSGTNLVIEQVSDSASFVVDTTGRFTIHTLVYDSTTLDLGTIQLGVTQAATVNALLVQGGGDICAALDVQGVRFNVESCDSVGVNCRNANTGLLQIIGNDVRCFEGNSITTALRFIDAPTVPNGYAVGFIITQGDSSVITQINNDLSLTVDSADLYRIQVIVYDSAAVDLDSLITLGTTTAGALNDLLEQGGGNICATLDTVGIVFDVRDCNDVDCEDDVATGRLRATPDGACLNENLQATISAQIDVPATEPLGYDVLYVLTSGSNLVIQEVSDEPSFNVNSVGQYRIHVLVYNPATLDLSAVDFGVTTAAQVNALLIQGGGDICAALDTTGVRFDVSDCSCGANPGVLAYTRPGGGSTCLNEAGLVFLAGNTQQRPTVPLGYRRVYVLTSGDSLIIERVADIPVFGVRETGTYRIHTLIYDPATLNLNNVQLGVTSALTINALLRQGGGTICAGLELPGLRFRVRENCDDDDDDDDDEEDDDDDDDDDDEEDDEEDDDDDLTGSGAPMRAYPNPATNQLNVNLPRTSETIHRITMEMIDVNGNVAKRWQMDRFVENNFLDITDLQPGMYYLRVLYDQDFVQEMNIVKVR